MTKAKVYLPWYKIEDACHSLVSRLPRPIGAVCPIGRGGLVPASIVSYKLDVPVLELIIPERLDHGLTPPYGLDRYDVLIIDDVCDTGRTFRKVQKYYKNGIYAAVYRKPEGADCCPHFAQQYEQDEWLVMPWAPDDVVNR